METKKNIDDVHSLDDLIGMECTYKYFDEEINSTKSVECKIFSYDVMIHDKPPFELDIKINIKPIDNSGLTEDQIDDMFFGVSPESLFFGFNEVYYF